MNTLFTPRMPTKRQWIAGAILFCAYFAASLLAQLVFTPPAVISAVAGIALAGLVLEGIALWPAVYAAALVSYIVNHAVAGSIQPFVLVILPAAQTVQTVVAAKLLKKFRFDPMFNHIRDGIWFVIIGVATSIITPTFGFLAYSINHDLFRTPYPGVTWNSWWGGTIMSVLVVGPFLIRWLYRPVFKRNAKDALEVLVAFLVLFAIVVPLFFTSAGSLDGISLVYFMLIPLFWIAIRIGPRFMMLAILIVGIVSIAGIFWGAFASPASAAGIRIFQMEALIITLACIFLVLVSGEEERKEALKGVRSKMARLESEFGAVTFRDRTKSEFIAVLAHELRNPLAPIMSSIELLRLQNPMSEENAEILDEMDDRVKTIRRLLDDILDVSRISQNKFKLQKEYVELQKVVVSALRSVQRRLEDGDQNLFVNIQKQPIYLNIDAVRIEQVVTNLLTNASKFTKHGGSISVSLYQDGQFAEIRVKDDGVGIDPAMLKRIFEPFLQVEGNIVNEGLGIGLSLAKQLVDMHDGTIEAKSRGPGYGSEFIVRLPVFTASEKQEMPHNDTDPAAAIQNDHTARRVLVIDDNTAAANAIVKLLCHLGWAAEATYTGTQAIDRTGRFRPEVIILDIGLPDIDGYRVADILRTEMKFKGTLIALTGYGQDEDKEKAFAAGFDHHLTKPVGIADIQNILTAPK